VNGSTVIKNELPARTEVTAQSAIAGTILPGYDAQALTITAVRHVFIVIADLRVAISMLGLIAILFNCPLFSYSRRTFSSFRLVWRLGWHPRSAST
jgi:hypothetical protein